MALGRFFDLLGETESQNDIYTLVVYKPPRPPPKYLPAIFTRTPVTHLFIGTRHTIKPDNYGSKTPNYDEFSEKDLAKMHTKIVRLKAWQFPVEMRCAHVQPDRECEEGCYVLEKGGDIRRWSCKRKDCKGHVHERNVLMDKEGRSCFGKKGKRMVCKAEMEET
jgi:hypothetical protein